MKRQRDLEDKVLDDNWSLASAGISEEISRLEIVNTPLVFFKESRMLRVTGIIYLILSILWLPPRLIPSIDYIFEITSPSIFVVVMVLIMISQLVINLIMGYCGFRYWKDPVRGKVCFWLGVTTITLYLVYGGLIMYVLESTLNWWAFGRRLILPVCYTIGAFSLIR